MSNSKLTIGRLLPWFILAEAVSYLGYYLPWVGVAGFIAILLTAFALGRQSLDYLAALLVAELIIGSKGHLFGFSLLGFDLSIRMALWLLLLAFYWWPKLGLLIAARRKQDFLAIFSLGRLAFFWPLLLFIIFGLANGLVSGNNPGLVYADANAWLFFLLLWPASQLAANLDAGKSEFYRTVISVAIFWLLIKTWLVLYVFSHQLLIMPDFYKWIRDSGVGEITAMKGSFYRVFIQSHLFALLALAAVWFKLLLDSSKHQLRSLLNDKPFLTANVYGGLLLSVVLIGLSRSFWVGLVVVLAFTPYLFFLLRKSWLDLFRSFMIFAASLLAQLALALFLIAVILIMPYHKQSASFDATEVLSERVSDSEESAIGSRWALLPVLRQGIAKRWLLGSGFGSTLTYQSQDPRVVSATGGIYTTYAFEWGWLDLWFKLGFFGLLAYMYVFYRLWLAAYGEWRWAVRLILLALATLHIFTPYINHPLGIGAILLVSALVFGKDLPVGRKSSILDFINFKIFKA